MKNSKLKKKSIESLKSKNFFFVGKYNKKFHVGYEINDYRNNRNLPQITNVKYFMGVLHYQNVYHKSILF